MIRINQNDCSHSDVHNLLLLLYVGLRPRPARSRPTLSAPSARTTGVVEAERTLAVRADGRSIVWAMQSPLVGKRTDPGIDSRSVTASRLARTGIHAPARHGRHYRPCHHPGCRAREPERRRLDRGNDRRTPLRRRRGSLVVVTTDVDAFPDHRSHSSRKGVRHGQTHR
jgi:hypothetical protein